MPQLLRQATTQQRRTLLAAAMGWMLDAFDAMLYALVLAHVNARSGHVEGHSGAALHADSQNTLPALPSLLFTDLQNPALGFRKYQHRQDHDDVS
jgi:hypothetical protein